MIARKIEQLDEQRPQAAARRERAGARVRLGHGQRGRRDGSGRRRRTAGRARTRARLRQARQRARVPGPDADAAITSSSTCCTRTCSTRRCSRRGAPRSAAAWPARSSAITVADRPAIAARLAVLFETARDFADERAEFYFIAAQHAVGLFAFREALSLAERGLKALRGLPEGPQRTQQELGLQMIRGLALRDDEGLGRAGARTGVRPRPAAVPASWTIRRALSRALGADVVPRDPRRPARVPRARRTS